MNERADAPAQVSQTDLDRPAGLHNPGQGGLDEAATRDATVAALRANNPLAEANDLSTDDGEDDDTVNDLDATESATGLNPDPDVEKSAGAAELMTPDTAPGPEDN